MEGEKLVVCMGSDAQRDAAEALAGRLNVPLSETPGEYLTLLAEEEGISLTGFGLSFRGDFEKLLPRIRTGRLQHEMLVHVARTKNPHPKAIDATAGMGEDALLLAACGYEVTMYEQNAVIAQLLKDTMRRAGKNPMLSAIIERMHLVEGNSIELMPKQAGETELVYLDPMFPARQKSGLINKKLQLIQKLEQPCVDEGELLGAAMLLRPKKIVIKRPLKGAYLAGKEPSYTIRGKAIRYDCIVPA